MVVAGDDKIRLDCHRTFENTIVRQVSEHRNFAQRSDNCCSTTNHLQHSSHIFFRLIKFFTQYTSGFGKNRQGAERFDFAALGEKKGLFSLTTGEKECRDE